MELEKYDGTFNLYRRPWYNNIELQFSLRVYDDNKILERGMHRENSKTLNINIIIKTRRLYKPLLLIKPNEKTTIYMRLGKKPNIGSGISLVGNKIDPNKILENILRNYLKSTSPLSYKKSIKIDTNNKGEELKFKDINE